MGTRRSRHNKGRKPLYKEHRLAARELLSGGPKYIDGRHLDNRLNWSDEAQSTLVTLCLAEADIEQSAALIGRSPKVLANRVRDLGVPMPSEWSKLVKVRRERKLRQPREAPLAYPYIRRQRDDHATVLAVNSLVPKHLPSAMRADVCQEIILGILEGTLSLDRLRTETKPASWFIKNFYDKNYEDGGHAQSLDAKDEDGMSRYDVVANIAAREWLWEERASDAVAITQSRRRIQQPMQIEEVFNAQVIREHGRRHALGDHLDIEDVRAELEAA